MKLFLQGKSMCPMKITHFIHLKNCTSFGSVYFSLNFLNEWLYISYIPKVFEPVKILQEIGDNILIPFVCSKSFGGDPNYFN